MPQTILVVDDEAVARAGLGGIVSYQMERGLVFSPSAAPREATQVELQNSGG